ncbi:MAG: acyl-CoA dehydrogenase, partial [Desulfobacteraceae bacterium]|nr:acyl-CoA dehydrogenase [Desulfobacteraceae bacterium]
SLELVESAEDRQYYQGLIDLFIPIVKAFNAQRAFDVCVQAMQVYGGYGYTKEYPVEQLVRDSKITSIYEGTDGIQSMDLLGRKIVMDGGKAFGDFMKEVQSTISRARKNENLGEMAGSLEKAANRLSEVCTNLAKTAASSDTKRAFAHSFPFLEAMGDVIVGWMLLWRAAIASEKLEKGPKAKDKAFYQGQRTTADFFIHTVLPQTLGKMESIDRMSAAAVDMEEAGFGS